tara:strand:- start:2963 stop:3700 length:738 start_codon:yes stop_codon:yes gene_type:complete
MFNKEDALIPFDTSPLPFGPWLVFAPHADDETFGMGGTLLKAKEEGVETHLVVLTDGSMGGNSPDIVETRIREVQQAAEILGFQSLQSWGEPDRLLEASENLVEKAFTLISKLQPASVFFPGPLEIHPDHRTAALLVWNALRMVADADIEFRPIAYEIGVQNPINLLINITEQISVKKEVMQIYNSQNQENNYPELVLALDKGRTFSLPQNVQFAEGFYCYELRDLDFTLDEITHEVIDRYQRLS